MSGRYLLDSNIVIALFANEFSVIKSIRQAGAVYIPSIVIGELCYGAFNSTKADQNLARVRELEEFSPVVPCDRDTAWHYGEIKQQLKREGKPIPENDIWIAATARQFDLILVTRDNHLLNVEGISVVSW